MGGRGRIEKESDTEERKRRRKGEEETQSVSLRRIKQMGPKWLEKSSLHNFIFEKMLSSGSRSVM